MFKSRYVYARMLMINDVFTCGGLEIVVVDVHKHVANPDAVRIECYNIEKPHQTIILIVARDETFKIKNRK